MKRLLFAATVFLLAACAAAPPPAPAPGAAVGSLPVDPALGWSGSAPAVERSYARAMSDLAAGRTDRARQRLAEIATHPPATLALGALALADGDLATAGALIDRATTAGTWVAADFYRADLAAARGDLAGARALLAPLAADPAAPPVVRERLGSIEMRLFDELYAQALEAPPAPAIDSLRRALAIRPDSTAARLLLVQNLIAAGDVAQARVEIDPLLRSPEAERVEVQQALAEIDAGRRRFEEAIARYEQIVARDPRPEYVRRLEELKQAFATANMPSRFRTAAESPALTRAELAILTYWLVSDVRFGRLPSEPPVAVDLVQASGRDELVRAITLHLFPIDPATRRVYPERVVTASNAARYVLRVLSLRGTPPCVSSVPAPGSTFSSTVRALAACGIDTAALQLDPDAPVSGDWARRALERADAVLSGE